MQEKKIAAPNIVQLVLNYVTKWILHVILYVREGGGYKKAEQKIFRKIRDEDQWKKQNLIDTFWISISISQH